MASAVRGARSDDTLLIAHRGFAGIYPENTLAAMEGSSKEGSDMIEIDVQPCADDTVVVFHDLRLDGKTDEEGIVTETDCETVLSAEVLDSGETIPTLEEAMDVIPASVAVNIELKYSGRADEDTEASELSNRLLPLVERTRKIALEQNNAILISSFFRQCPGGNAGCRFERSSRLSDRRFRGARSVGRRTVRLWGGSSLEGNHRRGSRAPGSRRKPWRQPLHDRYRSRSRPTTRTRCRRWHRELS